VIWFAIASLTPAGLLLLAALWGGPWPLLAVLSITVFVFFVDRLVSRLMPDTQERSGLWLSLVQASAHFVLWPVGVWAIGAGAHLDLVDKALLLVGLGLYFGQISNSNAHELIHNAATAPRRLGVAIYCSLLFGHHTSAHTRVHHVYAATLEDPNTARRGEGFWRFFIRAWSAGFAAGKAAEDRLRARASTPLSGWRHPYMGYLGGAGLALVAAFMLAGPKGLAALGLIAAYAQLQLYLSDYVQHYGLVRKIDETGKPEPMGPQHSWNAPHWYSSAMMLNAPRHSDHHIAPGRPFPQLRLDAQTMPILPHSLPVMAVLALVPPLWRRVMDPRVDRWRGHNAASPRVSACPAATA